METMMNPMQMIGLLKGRDPQQLVMSLIQNNNINDPMISELIDYAQKGDTANLTKMAEQFFQGQGKDFSSEFNSFMSILK